VLRLLSPCTTFQSGFSRIAGALHALNLGIKWMIPLASMSVRAYSSAIIRTTNSFLQPIRQIEDGAERRIIAMFGSRQIE
jgi:hypothetical protein